MSVHLSNLTRKGAILGRGYFVRPAARSVVVVGGATMDIKAHSHEVARLRTSNPGTAVTTPGGVGRNIAENLARLGSPTHLVAPVGSDAFGEQVVAHTRAAGVTVHAVGRPGLPTGTYLAVLDAGGELLVAVSTMAAAEALTVRDLEPSRDLVANADLLVVDGNVPAEPVAWLLDAAAEAGVRVVLDPVSVPKARRLGALLTPARPVLAVTPNLDELCALLDRTVPDTTPGIARAAPALHELGVTHVWVRRGTRGSLLSSREGTGSPAVHTLRAPAVDAVDVTGAGDAMTAAFVHAVARGDAPERAVAFGQTAAALTVASSDTVRPDLTARLIDAELHRAGRRPTEENR